MNTPNPVNPQRPVPRSPWRTSAIALVFLGGGFALGAASFASAGVMGWHHGTRIGMIQHVVHGALENVGATTAQETRIHDIIATTYTELDKSGGDREAMRKQIFGLIKAPTIDRAAVEKLRADKISEMDAKSKKIVGAILDAAGQLSPEQRAKLVQNVEQRMARGGWGHGGWGGWQRRDRMDGPDGGHGPDDHGPGAHGPNDDHG